MKEIQDMNTYQPVLAKAPFCGRSIGARFGYLEAERDFDPAILINLLTSGQHEGKILYIIRRKLARDLCTHMAASFDKIINNGTTSRPDDGYVLTRQIGATQFAKSGAAYVRAVAQNIDVNLDLLEEFTSSAVDDLVMNRELELSLLARGIHFGGARYKGASASFFVIRQWLDNGKMSLMPHEDVAQLACARRDDFEIGKVKTVLAYNSCVDASGDGGNLSIWDLEPDDECRKAFDVVETGYPYPPDRLTGVRRLSVRLEPGDVYFLNASFLHGVENVRGGRRITAGRFIGLSEANKAVYWT